MCLLWCDCLCLVVSFDLSMCNCVRRGIMLMIVCDVPLCVTLISLSMLYAVHIIRVICY